MGEPIISVSGLRGIVGESLDPVTVAKYSAAFAGTASAGPILVSSDGRGTGSWIANCVCGALRAAGRDVVSLGVTATPTVGVAVKAAKAAGAVQITASHNPSPYNGMKLFGADGRVLSAQLGERILTAYRANQFQWADHAGAGRMLNPEFDAGQCHWALIAKCIDVDRIRKAKFKVLLDANRGSGGPLGMRVLSELGCEVVLRGSPADGAFEHPPEPTAENLATVLKRVPQSGAVAGFCQDPDADRLAVIDENGRYLGEEYTLAICAKHVLSRAKGSVVINCATSRMTKDVAEEAGATCHVAPVGEANVVDKMLQVNAVLGGEGNGGVIDPRVVLVRDSFVSIALLLDAMAARQLPMSVLADELPRYAILKTKFDMGPERLPAALEALTKRFAEAKADRQDGLRLDWPDRWLLVRGSNTEPIVRAIAEAPTMDDARALCQSAGEILLTSR